MAALLYRRAGFRCAVNDYDNRYQLMVMIRPSSRCVKWEMGGAGVIRGEWECSYFGKGGAVLQRLLQLIDHLADRIEPRLPEILRSHIDSDFGENRLWRL